MRWLLFLSRLSFICGIFFLLAVSLSMKEWDEAISSTTIIIGLVIGLVVVPITDICYLVIAFSKKKLSKIVPPWLVTANVIFLFVLLFYIFYLNDPYYNQK